MGGGIKCRATGVKVEGGVKTVGECRRLRYLTLPEGRLQLSSAVSTRFLSAEKILKMLRDGKQDKHDLPDHSKLDKHTLRQSFYGSFNDKCLTDSQLGHQPDIFLNPTVTSQRAKS